MSSPPALLLHQRDPAPRRDLPTDLPAERRPRGATGIAIVLVAQLMLVLDATVVNVALPRIDADLGFGPGLAVVGAQRLHARLRRPAAARRPARRRPRPAAACSRSAWPSSPSPRSLGGLAQTPASWSPARAAPGRRRRAWPRPSVLALLTTSAPDEAARNRALALFGAVSSGGASIGLLLGGVVTDLGSWRWTLFINVPIGLALLALARRFVAETPAAPRPLRRRRRRSPRPWARSRSSGR